jgi:hypothetical protein
VDWINVAQVRDERRILVNNAMNAGFEVLLEVAIEGCNPNYKALWPGRIYSSVSAK